MGRQEHCADAQFRTVWLTRLAGAASRVDEEPVSHGGVLYACAVPWLTRLAAAVLRGRLEQEQDGLARDAVRNLERLGPTFLKLGQVLSIRCAPCQPRRL